MEVRNYAAEMAAYLETVMSAALQVQFDTKTQDASAALSALSELVRRGVGGAFEALVVQLRPILISLAVQLKPEDPRDLLSALYQAVLRGKRTLVQLEGDISTVYRNEWRGAAREKRKLTHLSLVHPQHQEAFIPGEVSLLFKYLSPDEKHLWIGVAEGKSLAELSRELGWSVAKTEKRWYELQERLRATLEGGPI